MYKYGIKMEIKNGKKGNHGGKRIGAGRKKLEGAKTKTISISGSDDEIKKIKKMAADSGKSVSRYIIELLLE